MDFIIAVIHRLEYRVRRQPGPATGYGFEARRLKDDMPSIRKPVQLDWGDNPPGGETSCCTPWNACSLPSASLWTYGHSNVSRLIVSRHGPSLRTYSAGSVNARKTSSRGASNSRAMTSLCPQGAPVIPVLFMAGAPGRTIGKARGRGAASAAGAARTWWARLAGPRDGPDAELEGRPVARADLAS